MMFSRLYGAKALLWERFMGSQSTPLRAELRKQYENGPDGMSSLESIGAAGITPGTFYKLRGGAKAYIIGQMHEGAKPRYWIGYIIDQAHGIYHEFNDWWPDGSTCSCGPMRAFDIVAFWHEPTKCERCGKSW